MPYLNRIQRTAIEIETFVPHSSINLVLKIGMEFDSEQQQQQQRPIDESEQVRIDLHPETGWRFSIAIRNLLSVIRNLLSVIRNP